MRLSRLDRFWIAVAIAATLALALGLSFLTDTLEPEKGRLGVVGAETVVVPATPTSGAPPFVSVVKAQGCTQKVTLNVPSGNGVLIQNTGTIQLKLSDSTISTPGAPLAPGAWIHVRFDGPGTGRITGTRYTCTNAGIAPPHLQIDFTVTAT